MAADEVTQLWHEFPTNWESALLHRELAQFNRQRLADPFSSYAGDAEEALGTGAQTENEVLDAQRAVIEPWMTDLPTNPRDFIRWFEELECAGPGQGDSFLPWLASAAPSPAMRWFLGQEAAAEAVFDGLCATNASWLDDEPGMMGGSSTNADVVWEALALGNLMATFVANADFTFHAVGAFGVLQLTSPTRDQYILSGLKRLSMLPTMGTFRPRWHREHFGVWTREILTPLLDGEPSRARPIAEGALLRMLAQARCFRRYREEWGLGPV